MKIFYEADASEYFQSRKIKLAEEIRKEDENRLLNVNETQYIDYLIARYQVDPLVFDWDNISADVREEMIPAERFPPFVFNVYAGKRYPKPVYRYYIPFSGNPDLLRLRPSSHILMTYEVGVEHNSIYFDVVDFYGDPERIKPEANSQTDTVRRQAQNLDRDVTSFNTSLGNEIPNLVSSRKQELLKRRNTLAALGVKVRERDKVSATFSVPIQHKPLVVKPQAPASNFVPEPTLQDDTYQAIIRIIGDMGVEMERHPSIYYDKEEETLRDHFLLVLSSHFDSVTGETFNKQGKTDILIRHAGSNIFVAECKFWEGKKGYYAALDQLLSYLTWRDSKTALIIFVKNKSLQPVLDTIEAETPSYPHFVKKRTMPLPGRFTFEFHLPDDATRGVITTVMSFHFPAT